VVLKDLAKRIKPPKAESPEKLLQLCFNIRNEGQVEASLPDVTMQLGGGAAVKLKAENSFVVLQEGTMCLAMVAASQ
jgi:hypothetical protein